LFSNAKDCDVNYFITDILNLRGETKIYFFNFIKEKLPHLYSKISKLYTDSYVDSNYEKKLENMLTKIEQNYPLKSKKCILVEEKLQKLPKQLTLFK